MVTLAQATQAEMSDQEWQARCDLAALYRIVDQLGMTYLIYTHLTARVPGEPGAFLINRFGDMFDEVTASSLVKLDLEGRVLAGSAEFNKAGFAIHSAVYKARPDVQCILHTHTVAGTAVSCLKGGLRPISQDALEIHDEVAYHEYGVPGPVEECEALGRSCAGAECIILKNHGLMTLGQTMQAAFIRMYYLERACQVQVAAAGANDETIDMMPDVRAQLAAKLSALRTSGRYGVREWETLLRQLDRRGSDHRR